MWFCLECSSGRDGNGVFILQAPRVGAFQKALNVAIPQATTNVTLNQLKLIFTKTHPKTLVISSTGNDILNDCDLAQIEKNRSDIVTLAVLNGVTKIVWINIVPFQRHENASPKEHATLKQAKLEHKKQMTKLGVWVANGYTLLTNPLNDLLIPIYIGDGFVYFKQAGCDAAWSQL